jgi:hypothetical protein
MHRVRDWIENNRAVSHQPVEIRDRSDVAAGEPVTGVLPPLQLSLLLHIQMTTRTPWHCVIIVPTRREDCSRHGSVDKCATSKFNGRCGNR